LLFSWAEASLPFRIGLQKRWKKTHTAPADNLPAAALAQLSCGLLKGPFQKPISIPVCKPFETQTSYSCFSKLL
jgi:hypothetical protein